MTLPATSRAAGRPPRLSRQALIERAIAILEEEGIEALTMRRLARDLESSPMALYGHVRDKDELLVAVLDHRAAGLPRLALPDDPRERLLALYGLLFEKLSEQPWIVPILMKGDLSAPSIFRTVDAILGSFTAAGLPPERAAAAYHVAWRYTVGEISVRQASRERRAAIAREPLITTLQRGAEPTELPHLAALHEAMATARERLEYQVGLAAVIDGLLAWRDPS
ncbi:MAG: TetR/AcrR family transcriptional regulator C-terminal domain-containing protein [Candidatus Dormibacteraeota bacterium]|uniref:TetR/AcrR family transcriptional regulator C-terminal domain-containing protein n=1 Tax=Candidatus Dormiibacter inghamiae TaxID=3127013 RepID=A0A934KGL1_9BACT|nr:TetR/AcrR family transcriptional regulator C-terminal domain-containing protein [Candidatus Dormibacteraeota bacterium]MBJ7607558.1 TetR/AcrR family transcriptional regulator C-terminal domain-containing protein [Candidatus Dormibacteraeota bacterium]